ncbi:YheC/YheD family protein [Paenibacillus sp. GCM10023252]|uniref:YheC/YheD family protein n=1 Tax=Paenibacillus sp. GCM10023252 TaxID=3252649 RepID=UPI003616B6F6
MGSSSISIKSKWMKTKWLLKSAKLRKYVPETAPYSYDQLRAMTERYPSVFFKPTGGTGGSHIVRIQKRSEGYRYQKDAKKQVYPSIDALHDKLKSLSSSRPYLLQRGIQLEKIGKRKFDIRVMVQKGSDGKWVSTGIFMKIGRSRRVATNYHQGGKIGMFRTTMRGAGYSEASTLSLEKELKQLGLSVGKHFDRQLGGFRELGLDVALDQKGRLWILEVNTRPNFYPLKDLKDKSMYRRIAKYARKYGRKG